MWARQVLAACIVVAACSPGDPQAIDAPSSSGGSDAGIDPNDGAVSGTRLKLTWYQFTDGTRQWSGMYDAQNKELCSPYYPPWTDGNTYCTPSSGGEIVYTNAGCTTKALHYYVDAVCPQPPASYYLEYATVGCESRPAHMYLRGSPVTAANYFYKNSNGTCGSANVAQSYDAFYVFGNEVPTSAFVKLTLGSPTGNSRLGVRYYQSADGLRFPWVLHDTMLDADCNASYYSNTSTAARCVPSDARYAYYAHDANCTQPELSLDSTCTTPKFAYTFPATSCPDDSETYYTVGAQTAAPPLFEPIGGSCPSQGTSSGTNYWSLGGQVTTAPLTYAADAGTAHRIQLIHYTTPEGARFRDPYTLYDSQMGTDCYPETLPDGTIRCVAYGGYIYSYFASSNCTVPIDVVEIYSGPAMCAAPVIPKYARKDVAPTPGTCAYGTEVHTITTPHPGVVYTGAPGACSAYTPFEASLYNVGPVVQLTDFVGAALAQDN